MTEKPFDEPAVQIFALLAIAIGAVAIGLMVAGYLKGYCP